MMLYVVLKYLHIVGAAVLRGTGSGIAVSCLQLTSAENPPSSRVLPELL